MAAWSAWAEGAAWDGSDIEVGSVSLSLRPPPEPDGWRARYWGHDESARSAHVYGGNDLTAVGDLWPSSQEAKEAVEERHAGVASCE